MFNRGIFETNYSDNLHRRVYQTAVYSRRFFKEDKVASEDHLEYRRTPFYPNVPESIFSEREIEVLSKYGSWMAALMRGEIDPETPAQSRFVEVCNGTKFPQSECEHAWAHFMQRKFWESENPEYIGADGSVFADLGLLGRGWGVYGHFR